MSDFPKTIPPLPPSIEPALAQYLSGVLGSLQLQIYQVREFLEPAIHSTQGTPETKLDDWE